MDLGCPSPIFTHRFMKNITDVSRAQSLKFAFLNNDSHLENMRSRMSIKFPITYVYIKSSLNLLA